MQSRATTNIDVAVLTGSILLTEAMLFLAMEIRKAIPFRVPLEPGNEIIPWELIGLVAVIWLTLQLIFSTPRLVRTGRLLDGIWRLIATVGLSSLTLAGMLFLSFRDTSRMFFIYFVLLDLVALVLFYSVARLIIRRRSQHGRVRSRVLVAGTGHTGMRLARGIADSTTGIPALVGFLSPSSEEVGSTIGGVPVLGKLEDAVPVIAESKIDEIIIALPLESHPRVVKLVRQLQSTPVHIKLVPDFLDFAVMHASVDYVEGLPVVGLRGPALNDQARIAKRMFDILSSVLLLAISAIPMLVIAFLVRRDSPGPALYFSDRVGENGRLFKMYKFRTMVDGADQRFGEVKERDEHGTLSFKNPGDPRITPVGRWLRRTSLDELPQLINVLKGEMSLVGPRPELPEIVREEYEPWQWSRFTVPQGMTGWWQVHRRGYEHQHLCTADDLYYIQNYSLLLDIKILFRTVLVVFTGQGAY